MSREKDHYDYELELLTCPFCGSTASIVTVSAPYRPKPVKVRCDNCRVTTEYRKRMHNAVKLWNKRANMLTKEPKP